MPKLINDNVFEYLKFNKEVEGGAMFAVPNEIFSDFNELPYGKRAYAYSYYYLSVYLHFYAKYGIEDNIDKFTFQGIQQLLGISPKSRAMNEITKKGGMLDLLGYTSTVTDYPVELIRIENIGGIELTHHMYSERIKDFPSTDRFKHGHNFTVKQPDKLYWRAKQDKLEDNKNGTMLSPENTHLVPLEMFLHAMNIDDIMSKGFYIYSYLIYMNDKSGGNGWKVSHEYLSEFTGVSVKTLKGILKSLEKHGFISVTRAKTERNINATNVYFPIKNPKLIK